MRPTLDAVARVAADWQAATFTGQTTCGMMAHLAKETLELDRALHYRGDVSEELADCFLLIVGMAALEGIDLAAAAARKLSVNQRRTWKAPGPDGAIEHEK